MIKPWPQISSRVAGDFRIFTIRTEVKVSPRTGQPHDFVVIDSVNWVNVVALTPAGEIILVEQFRHGTNTVELEIPGGMIDPEDASPVAAGTRELQEETGYEGENALVVGRVYPNPAIMSNTCFTVLVRNCQLRHSTLFDHGEDLVPRLVPVGQIPDLVSSGQIRHSLVVAALSYFELWRRRSGNES